MLFQKMAFYPNSFDIKKKKNNSRLFTSEILRTDQTNFDKQIFASTGYRTVTSKRKNRNCFL